MASIKEIRQQLYLKNYDLVLDELRKIFERNGFDPTLLHIARAELTKHNWEAFAESVETILEKLETMKY